MRAEPNATGRATGRLIAAFGSTSLALLITSVWLYAELRAARRSDATQLQAALRDPAVRDLVLRDLLRGVDAVWDTHNDPDVGRVLQPNLHDKPFRGTLISSNLIGLRERNFAVPKPAGTRRIVLLGDSFVFGYGVAAEDRLGVFLERYLGERTGSDTHFEVLHIAASSWNLVSECAYLRRQLSFLQPDIVLHATAVNDLDDTQGVRGFGVMSRFSPRNRDHGDTLVCQAYGPAFLGTRRVNSLADGLDHLSLARFATARRAVRHLATALGAHRIPYCLLVNWGVRNARAADHLVGDLTPEQVVYVQAAWAADEQNQVGDGDSHWNRHGMEQLARACYALLAGRGMLHDLELPAWPEASRAFENALSPRPLAQAPEPDLARRLDLAADLTAASRQIYSGLAPERHVSPYAALLLGRGANDRFLHLEGQHLDQPEIAGGTVTVWADGQRAGSFQLVPGHAIDERWPLPAGIDASPCVAIELRADDWVYQDPVQQKLAVFRLDRIGLEP